MDTYFEDEVDEEQYINPALYYLAMSIDYLGQADALYMVKGWERSKGCRVERKAAKEYGIKILETDYLKR